jgi:hypothetical protein
VGSRMGEFPEEAGPQSQRTAMVGLTVSSPTNKRTSQTQRQVGTVNSLPLRREVVPPADINL